MNAGKVPTPVPCSCASNVNKQNNHIMLPKYRHPTCTPRTRAQPSLTGNNAHVATGRAWTSVYKCTPLVTICEYPKPDGYKRQRSPILRPSLHFPPPLGGRHTDTRRIRNLMQMSVACPSDAQQNRIIYRPNSDCAPTAG